MKKTTLLLLGLFATGAFTAYGVPVRVVHSEAGAFASELSAVLAADGLSEADVTELAVAGDAYLSIADCAAIAGLKATLSKLDLSEAVFADNAIPQQAKENAGTFSGMNVLSECVLPESLTAIGNGAFANCKNLVRINIPAGVTLIPKYCFTNCEKLSEINLPEGLTTLNGYSFKNCKALTLAELPSTVTIIRDEVFNGSPVRFTELPAGLTTLGNNALSNTKATLKDLPEGVTKLGNAVFAGSTVCFATLPEQITQIGIKSFANVSTMREFEIPDRAGMWEKIPNGTFFLDAQVERTFVCRSPQPPAANVSTVSLSSAECGAFGKVEEFPMITLKVPVAAMPAYEAAAPYSSMNIEALTVDVEWPEIIYPDGDACAQVEFIVGDEVFSTPGDAVFEGEGSMKVSFLENAPDNYYVKEIRLLADALAVAEADGTDGDAASDVVYSCPDVDKNLRQPVEINVDVKPGMGHYSVTVAAKNTTPTGVDEVLVGEPVRRGDLITLAARGGQLFDMAGRLVSSTDSTLMSLEGLPKGVYILRQGGQAFKIVK